MSVEVKTATDGKVQVSVGIDPARREADLAADIASGAVSKAEAKARLHEMLLSDAIRALERAREALLTDAVAEQAELTARLEALNAARAAVDEEIGASLDAVR